MYLLLVGAWLIAACFFLYLALLRPDNQVNFLFAGFAALMVLYNLVRWWSRYQFARQRRLPGPPPVRPGSARNRRPSAWMKRS
jgi:hypothetical protein